MPLRPNFKELQVMIRAKAGVSMVLLVAAAIFFAFFMEDKLKAKFISEPASAPEASPASD